MAKDTTKDMTSGSPMKLILNFAVPLFLGMLFQQVYNLVDTIIVGKVIGVHALAAVGATGSINFLIIGFCNGMCSGFALPVAQRFGARDERGLKKNVGNSAVLSIIIGLFITVVTSLLCYDILVLMKTPADIIQLSYEYIVVIFIGIPAIILYNLLSGYIRSLGDSITPLIFLLIAAVLNIVLDVVFVISFEMGVYGAALATVISQGVSGLLCLYHIWRKFPLLHLSRDDWRLDWRYVSNLLANGLPMGFQYSITAIGSVILQRCVNVLGSVFVAAMTAGSKLTAFLACPFDALGSTMATYGGQNVGAGKLDRLKAGITSSTIISIIYSVLAFIAVYFFSTQMFLLFVDAGEVEVMQHAREYLLINVGFFLTLAWVNIIRFMIQGMGFSIFAVIAGVLEMAARTGFGLLVSVWGFTAASYASPAAWIAADIFLIPGFFLCKKRLEKRMNAKI